MHLTRFLQQLGKTIEQTGDFSVAGHCLRVIPIFVISCFFLELSKPDVKFPQKQKRRCLIIQQQKNILDYIADGKPYNWIEEKTGTKSTTISKIKQRKLKILGQLKENENFALFRKVRHLSHPQVEKATFLWFIQERSDHRPISMDSIRQTAHHFHSSLCTVVNCEFKASYGWGQKFLKRHAIRLLKVTGEKLSGNQSAIGPFRAELLELIKQMELRLEQIYNADESGLMFRMLLTYTLVASNEMSAPGRKMTKERITFLPCSNVTGSHRIALQVIGKSANPRCFSGKELPGNLVYHHSKKAWQTRALFSDWFYNTFVPSVKSYSKQLNISAKALLVLDNAPCHSIYDNFGDDNIKVIFLPPNCTSLLQPMD